MTPPKEGGHETPDQSSLGILPAKHWMTQAAELDFQGGSQDDEDADSAFGGDTSSSTASISSSILKYRTLNGRTYHSERGNAQYWGSNDERANETMDINHHVLTLVLGGKLFLAPLEKDKIHKVLDVGTGTGIWAIDFADQFPNTEVVGTDVSPIQPTWVPPNLKFEIEDCTQDWTFAPNSIDYIHMRWLVGSIDDWTALMRRAYDALRPGGYIESFEASSCIVSDDGSVTDDSAMGQWGKFFHKGGRMLGRTFTVVEDQIQRKAVEEAGFVDIHEIHKKTPLGGWPKDPKERELGRYVQLMLEQDPEGLLTFMANTLGWSREEITTYLAHLRREIRSIRSKDLHPYYHQTIVWARKPGRAGSIS